PGLVAARESQRARAGARDHTRTLMILPGSRRAEVKGLLKPFGEIVRILHERGNRLDVVVPTVPHVAGLVREASESWAIRPQIVEGAAAKWQAFGRADAALAASGTVLLELAMAGVPSISCYRMDALMNAAQRLISTWSAALPNIIADRAIVPEFYNEAIRPPMLARYVEGLLADGPARDAQLAGFDHVRDLMATARPSGEIAAEVVLNMLDKKTGA
ncbi:MAG: lipid-A-disaccharide synthase, partial [Mesorhizobium sp.]